MWRKPNSGRPRCARRPIESGRGSVPENKGADHGLDRPWNGYQASCACSSCTGYTSKRIGAGAATRLISKYGAEPRPTSQLPSPPFIPRRTSVTLHPTDEEGGHAKIERPWLTADFIGQMAAPLAGRRKSKHP